MFMLNLLFDLNDDNGQFSLNAPGGGAFRRSKDWLKLKAAPPDPAPVFLVPPSKSIHPGVQVDWDPVGDCETGPLHIPHDVAGETGIIAVRFAHRPLPGPNPIPPGLAGATLTYAVCFGRPTMLAPGGVASPFWETPVPVAPAQRRTLTTFVGVGELPYALDSGLPVGWCFHLAVVNNRPGGVSTGNPHAVHFPRRYEFAVGITVTTVGPPSVTRHYSLDPDMDIGPDP